MSILRFAAVLAVTGLGLSACGVRGDLEPPPGAEAAAATAAPTGVAVVQDPILARRDLIVGDDDERTDRVIESQRRTPYPPASDSFILDPLL